MSNSPTMANTPCLKCINLNGSSNRYICNSSKSRLEDDIVDGTLEKLPSCPFFVEQLSHEILTQTRMIVAVKASIPVRFVDILGAISSYKNRTGRWPSQRQIWRNSEQASMTSVWNILREMTHAGILEKIETTRGKTKHLYVIVDGVSSAV